MNIAIYQLDITWGNPEENLNKIQKTIIEIDGKCDLLILPEMFTTGFTINPTAIAEKMDGKSASVLKCFSQKYNIAIMGSIVIDDNGDMYNRMLFFTPDGKMAHYDKRHLFRMSGEHNHFKAGVEQPIFHYKGFNILPQICYDLRFPVWSRNTGNKYDIAIYIASWPIPRIKVWDVLLQARALENNCYVVGVNRVGNDPSTGYNGHSYIIDYMGKIMAQTEENKQHYVICNIEKDPLDRFRETFPTYLDSDKFSLDI